MRGAGAAAALAVSPEGANAKVEDVTQVRVTGTGVRGAGGMRARVERSGADGRLARHTSSRTIPSVSTGGAGASSDNGPPAAAAWQRGRREKEHRNGVQQTPAQLGPPRAKATASRTGGKREWRGGQELKGAVLGLAGGITGGGRTLTVQEGVTEVPVRKWGSTVWFSLPDLRL